MSFVIKAIRNILGYIIVFANWVSRPKPANRSPEVQGKVQSAFDGHSLYQLTACPFCVKTRRAIHGLNIDIDIRDIGRNMQFREELEQGGGRIKVPCLKIEEEGNSKWLYESNDIINYLNQRVEQSIT